MPQSIPQFLIDVCQRFPDKTAIWEKSTSVTFRELLQGAIATAESLREIGIRPGDRVGICMEKSIEQVLVILGVLYANAILVPILPRLKGPNIRHIIDNSGMVAMVTDAQRLSEVEDFAEFTKLVVGRGEVDERWPNLAYMRKHIAGDLFYDRIGKDNAAIIYSSGSTGRPKGILISHQNLTSGSDIVIEYLGTTEKDRIGCILSLNFDYGLNQLWQTLRTGCTLYLHEFAFPNDFFALVAEQRITAVPVMPVIISQMFDKRLKAAEDAHDMTSVRYVCSTGGRLSQEMISNLHRAFPKGRIFSMFGLTEAFRSTYLDPASLESHPTSIGKTIPDCEVFVMDESGAECPPNVAGELVQRGATVAKGYWRDSERTAQVFRSHPSYPGETLVFSGDQVVRDEDGYLYFVARKDEMIKTRGFRVSPTEVELGVVEHPNVTNAVAFAVPNVAVGEDIACAYTTDNGEPAPDQALTQHLKSTLPRHMVPAYLLHFTEFPITGNSGKFDRKSIKETAFKRLGLERSTGAGG